jgi:hypothetical protein
MRALSLALVLLLGNATSIQEDTYFPKGIFGAITRYVCAYHLGVFREPSLLRESKESGLQSYRFLWLRTFHHAVVIRVDILPDGTGTLITKTSSGEAGFGVLNRKIIEDISRSLSRDELRTLLKALNETRFWSIPTVRKADQTGEDGADWLLEGVKDGRYHAVLRWSPCGRSGPGKSAVCSLGRELAFHLAHLNIPKDEVY